MKSIETIIRNLRVAMTDARQNESHFESWMILNEAICDAIDALAEQPAQQQEPVEYVRKMIDALYENGDPVSVEAAELLERMTRQQQEPAAWVETREDGSIYYGVETDTVISDDPSWLERPMPVYTSPPASKPWVGLTQQDIDIAFDDTQEGGGFDEFARAIEAKLREKNA